MDAAELVHEMAFEKKVAEAKIRAKEETINLHVIKLLAFDVEAATRTYWRKEIFAETRFLAAIGMRVGKQVRHPTAAEYFALLYTEPFAQNEIPYTEALIDIAGGKAEQAGSPIRRNDRQPHEIAAAVYRFHAALCSLLADRDGGRNLLEGLGA